MVANADINKAVEKIRKLQQARDMFEIGSSERNTLQSMINSLIVDNDIDPSVVAAPFNTGVDLVNDPPHYKQHAMECIDEMVEVFGVGQTMSYCRCAAWKYRYRAPYKGNADLDNSKADWYIKKLHELSVSLVNRSHPVNHFDTLTSDMCIYTI